MTPINQHGQLDFSRTPKINQPIHGSPNRATHVGKNIPTNKQEVVRVFFEELGDKDRVATLKGNG